MYSVTISDNKITVTFNRFTDYLDLLNVLYFYKNNPGSVIVKITVSREVNGILWYNDITAYKTQPTPMLLLMLRERAVKGGVEDTHITSASGAGPDVTIVIETLNRFNDAPVLVNRDVFVTLLFSEWLLMCTGTPM